MGWDYVNQISQTSYTGRQTFSWNGESVDFYHLQPADGLCRPVQDRRMLIDWTRLCLKRAFSIGLPAEMAAIIRDSFARIEQDISKLDMSRENFGLLHADFVPTNYLLYHGECRPIDFSGAVFGWYSADIAIALASLT